MLFQVGFDGKVNVAQTAPVLTDVLVYSFDVTIQMVDILEFLVTLWAGYCFSLTFSFSIHMNCCHMIVENVLGIKGERALGALEVFDSLMNGLHVVFFVAFAGKGLPANFTYKTTTFVKVVACYMHDKICPLNGPVIAIVKVALVNRDVIVNNVMFNQIMVIMTILGFELSIFTQAAVEQAINLDM